MMAGRRKKPSRLHVLQGTYRADRHDPAAIGEVVPLEPPPVPAYVRRRRRARALWDEHAPGLAALGVLERLDADHRPEDFPLVYDGCRRDIIDLEKVR